MMSYSLYKISSCYLLWTVWLQKKKRECQLSYCLCGDVNDYLMTAFKLNCVLLRAFLFMTLDFSNMCENVTLMPYRMQCFPIQQQTSTLHDRFHEFFQNDVNQIFPLKNLQNSNLLTSYKIFTNDTCKKLHFQFFNAYAILTIILIQKIRFSKSQKVEQKMKNK